MTDRRLHASPSLVGAGLAFALLLLFFFSSCATKPAASSTGAGHTKTGSGLFLVTFDYPTGQVTKVDVLKSTGSATLDATSIQAFRKWQAKPRTFTQVKVPITYTIKGDTL